jgi:hypothetical protein
MRTALVEVDKHCFVSSDSKEHIGVIGGGCHLYVLEQTVVLHFSWLDHEDGRLGIVLAGNEEVAVVIGEVGVERRRHCELVVERYFLEP